MNLWKKIISFCIGICLILAASVGERCFAESIDDPTLCKIENANRIEYKEDVNVSLREIRYVHDDRFSGYQVQHGIDVSKWNGNSIDYDEVKKSGIDFVIVRVAYRGYGKDGNIVMDPYYANNIRKAKAAGLEVGAYIFSQAISEEEAVEEAKYLISAVKNFDLDIPLVMDYEFAGDSDNPGRLSAANLSKREMTDICNAFTKTVNDAGHESMIYANYIMLNNYLYKDEVSENAEIWLARYNYQADYDGEYSYWQYASNGIVNGITGRVDMNFRYVPNNSNSILLQINKTGHKTVELEWNAVNGIDGYAIYREDGDGTYNKVTSVGQNVTKYADNQCAPNTKYTYRIMTYEWNGSKYVYSDPVYVSATTMGYEPDKVENVHVYNTTNNSIWLGWDSDWEKYADGYNVYRSETKGGEYAKIGTVAKGKVSYADYDIEHGKTYYYYIKAYSQVNEDIYEGTASNIYQYTPNLMPSKTNNLRIYKVTAGSQWLGWNDATKTSGYVVYRKEGVKGTYEKVETVTGGKTAWADYDLEHGKTYYYYVRAYNAVNGKYYYGAISNTISYTVNFVPGETTNLRVYNSTETSRWLGWNDATKAEGYVVYKREDSKGSYEKIETVTGGKTSCADYEIEKGKTYQYYVRSYAGVQGTYYYGKISNIITVKIN